jgi:hypothetical protein
MVNIIKRFSLIDDQPVSVGPRALIQELQQDQCVVSSLPFPLMSRFPLPTSSPTLARVLNIPEVDRALYLLRIQRLKLSTSSIYILPQAKPNLGSKDEELFPLLERVQEFLYCIR